MADIVLVSSVSCAIGIALGLALGLAIGVRLGWRDQDTTVARLQGMLRRSERDALAARREVDALQARGRMRIVGSIRSTRPVGGSHAG